MSDQLNSNTFLPWLAQEAHKLAQATLTGGDPFPELWGVAVDALDWLRHAPSDERGKALETVKQCLEIGASGEITIPADEHEAECFRMLLQWVVKPPPVL
jgi:hypothetical protein